MGRREKGKPMSQSEINDVVAAVEALVRRAYTLGRRDGLRHLVKYAQSDEAVAKPLALLAPAAEGSSFDADDAPKVTANDTGAPIPVPDESVPMPHRAAPAPSGSLGAMILDFVYPPKAS
jgi:hypothetical protein